MKKLALLAIVCCAMVFTSCHRDQHTYYTEVSYSQPETSADVISLKAVLKTISLFWVGDFTFTGNDESYTDVLAKTKFLESKTAIWAHGGELKEYLNDGNYFYYRLYRKSDNALLESTKYYVDEDGKFALTDEVDNVQD
jgi:hypothetical protein